nr:hypothetical protein [Pseudodesulfovibrio sp.]
MTTKFNPEAKDSMEKFPVPIDFGQWKKTWPGLLEGTSGSASNVWMSDIITPFDFDFHYHEF